jgi:hypothetical protein
MLSDLFKSLQPRSGSILIATLYGGLGEYSGVYVGHREVVTITSKHRVEKMSLEQFSCLHSTSFKSEIYSAYGLFNRKAIFFPEAAERALNNLNISYRRLLMNSHQFCSGCITGNFDNEDLELNQLKLCIQKHSPYRHSWHKLS